MANLLHPVQVHKHTTAFGGAGVTYTVTLDNPCVAGSRVVVLAAGGAQTTVRFTNGAGTLFTRRAQALSAMDSSIHDAVAAGGETALHVTLNGDENVWLKIHHTDLGAFIAGSDGTPASDTAGNFSGAPSSAVSVSGDAVLFSAFGVVCNTAQTDTLKFRGLGPVGQLVNDAHQPGSGTKFVCASGISDVTAAGNWPVTASAGDYRATSVWVNGNSDTLHVAQAAYADASGDPTVPAPANPIAAENSLPGTFQGNWFAGSGGTNATIAGYFDKTSYEPGDTVAMKVNSTGNPWRAEIYRLGNYGWESFGARLATGFITGTPSSQSAPTVDGTLGSTSCAWTTTATWTIPADAPSGVYYVLFRRTDDTSKVASGHFTVREASVSDRVVVVMPDITYQSYNLWGAIGDNGSRFSPGVWSGRSLYALGTDATNDPAHRSYAVSFDRPTGIQASQTNTYLFDADYPWIHWAEAQGYNLTYVSDIDLELDPTLLQDAAAVVMLGHHEYWTTNVFDAFRNAQAAGVNMLVHSSNTALWRVRFAAGDTAKRTVICYKDSATKDVTPGWAGTGYDPGGYTGTWRDARTVIGEVNNPDVRRENSLTGQMFVLSAPLNARYVVPAASKSLPCWRNNAAVQALTAGQEWQAPAGTIGDEGDAADGSAGQPSGVVNLCPTPVSGSTGANAAGTIYSSTVTPTMGFTMFRHSSGALIVNTGSWRAQQGLSRWAQSSLDSVVTAASVAWQNSYLALLYDLGVQPVAAREMRPGIDTAPTNPATGAPSGDRNAIARAYGLEVPGGSSGFLTFFE